MVNRWIVGIKLFQFELVHVPGKLHTGPDGLSWRAISPNDLVEEDDADDWLDKTMSFAIILMNSRPSWASRLNVPYGLTQSSSLLLNQLKSKKVKIGKEKTSRMIIKGKLSERAVMKEKRLGQVSPQERR